MLSFWTAIISFFKGKDPKKPRKTKDKKSKTEKKDTKTNPKEPEKKSGGAKLFVTNIIAGIVDFVSAIPATILAIKLVALLLAGALIIAILASAIAFFANMFIDATVASSAAMNWHNKFDEIKLSRTVSKSDGSYRTVIQKVNNGGNVTQAPVTYDDNYYQYDYTDVEINTNTANYTDDLTLWTTMSDAQLMTLAKQVIPNEEDRTADNVNYTANVFRMIRMAYNICYATDDNDERYIKGLEPYTLLGIISMEKGYNWCNANTVTKTIGADAGETGWLYPSGSSWAEYLYSTGTPDYNKMNIDDCISTLFLDEYKHDKNYYDGPMSWSIMTPYDEDGPKMIDYLNQYCAKGEAYHDLYMQLANKNEYKAIKNLYDPSENKLSDPNDYMIAMVFPSMLMTAINFDLNYYDGNYVDLDADKIEYDLDSTFAQRYLQIDKSILFNDAMDNGLASEYQARYRGDTLGYLGSMALNKNAMSDEERLTWVKQLANMLYYSYHHACGFADAFYPKAFVDSDGNTIADTELLGEYLDSDDWYFSQLFLNLMFLDIAEGNISNISNPSIVDYYGKNDKFWLPLNTTYNGFSITYCKFGYGGDWFNGDIRQMQFEGLSQLQTDIASETYGGKDYTSRYLRVGNTQLDTSIWDFVYNQHGCDISRIIDPETVDTMHIPLAFSAAASNDIYNLHAFHFEGAVACTIGSDLIEQCISGILELESEDAGGSGGGSGGSSGGSDDSDDGSGGSDNDLPAPDDDIVASDLPEDSKKPKGTYEYWLLPGQYKSNSGSPENIFMPVVDYDPKTAGVNNPGVSYDDICVRNGYGKYSGGGAHYGIDFPGYTSDDWFNNAAWAFMCDTSKGIPELGKLITYVDENAANGYYDRIPIVSIADGWVVGCGFGAFESIYDDGVKTSGGNYIDIESIFLISDASGNILEQSLTHRYLHMGPDTVLIWNEYSGGKLADYYTPIINQYKNSKLNGSYTLAIDAIYGMKVEGGQLLGYMGNTGSSDGLHLHLGGTLAGTDNNWGNFGDVTGIAYYLGESGHKGPFSYYFQGQHSYKYYLDKLEDAYDEHTDTYCVTKMKVTNN